MFQFYFYFQIRPSQGQFSTFSLKLDFSQAFFNINLYKDSRYITTFKYNSKYHFFNYLPFGLLLAPFVMQTLLNQIMKFLRNYTSLAWGHIDDVVTAHKNPEVLKTMLQAFLPKLKSIGWRLNMENSVLGPLSQIVFLGAIWSSTGVKRLPSIKDQLSRLISAIRPGMDEERIQKTRGLLNYYLSFAGHVHTIISRILRSGKGAEYLHMLTTVDEIKFLEKQPTREECAIVHIDATPIRLGWMIKFEGKSNAYTQQTQVHTIIRAELLGIQRDAWKQSEEVPKPSCYTRITWQQCMGCEKARCAS